MINNLRKFFLILVLLNFCVSCVNVNSEHTNLRKLNINSPSDKFIILLVNDLNRLTNNLIRKNNYNLYVEVKFESKSVLNIRGKDALNQIKGIIIYKLTDFKTDKIIKEGKTSQNITHGSIESLYGKNKNEIHIKERLVRSLSKKTYNKIKLYLH